MQPWPYVSCCFQNCCRVKERCKGACIESCECRHILRNGLWTWTLRHCARVCSSRISRWTRLQVQGAFCWSHVAEPVLFFFLELVLIGTTVFKIVTLLILSITYLCVRLFVMHKSTQSDEELNMETFVTLRVNSNVHQDVMWKHESPVTGVTSHRFMNTAVIGWNFCI